ncbi:MAG: CPBP family intramembrane metalloprotease [Arenimonas sp.]|nr:CPBP family intramembrane metalloprotease [Arenimonas sp.]
MNSAQQVASTNRHRLIAPSVALASIGLIVYIAIFYGIAYASGIPYGEWFTTAENAIHSALLPLLVGSLFLGLFLAVTRWNAIWRDPVRLPLSRLETTIIWLFAAIVLLRLLFIRWLDVPTDLLWVVLAVGVGVGFAEEMALRGVFLRGLRSNGRSEGKAVLWTCVAFGLLHIPNIFLGTGVLGISQLLLAALSGFILYLFRRRFAWIVPAMVAHGIWDISVFLSADYLSETMNTLTIALTFLMQILALVALVLFVRREREFVLIKVNL